MWMGQKILRIKFTTVFNYGKDFDTSIFNKQIFPPQISTKISDYLSLKKILKRHYLKESNIALNGSTALQIEFI
jgi:hypothetical protein